MEVCQMNINSATRRLNRLEEQLRPVPKEYATPKEIHELLAVLLSIVAPFPDAAHALTEAFAGLDQRRPPIDWKDAHDVVVAALWPYMDARVAVAAAIVEAQQT